MKRVLVTAATVTTACLIVSSASVRVSAVRLPPGAVQRHAVAGWAAYRGIPRDVRGWYIPGWYIPSIYTGGHIYPGIPQKQGELGGIMARFNLRNREN